MSSGLLQCAVLHKKCSFLKQICAVVDARLQNEKCTLCIFYDDYFKLAKLYKQTLLPDLPNKILVLTSFDMDRVGRNRLGVSPRPTPGRCDEIQGIETNVDVRSRHRDSKSSSHRSPASLPVLV